MALKEDYLDDILDTSVNEKRKYRMINNADGTISLEDVTEYSQNGDNFGAFDINITNKTVNELIAMGLNVRWNSESDFFEVLQGDEWTASVVIAGVKEEVVDLNLDTRTFGTPSSTGSDASTSRTFDTSTYVIGLAQNNMYNSSRVSDVSFTEDSITQTAGGGFGTGIPLELEPNGTYELSCTASLAGSYAGAMFYNSSGSFIGVEGNHTDDNLTLPFTVPSNAKYSVLLFTASFSNIKLIKK